MLNKSFRLVTARLIPGDHRCKQLLLPATLILAGCILAGCGGSSAPKAPADWQTIRGPGFSFQAPAGWKVERPRGRVTAAHGSQLVQVARFTLQKPYDDKLFGRVAVELRARMQDIARQTGGALGAARTVTIDGVRSHAFDVTLSGRVDEYTFVFSGMREYLLLCRRGSSDEAGHCARLATSFVRA